MDLAGNLKFTSLVQLKTILGPGIRMKQRSAPWHQTHHEFSGAAPEFSPQQSIEERTTPQCRDMCTPSWPLMKLWFSLSIYWLYASFRDREGKGIALLCVCGGGRGGQEENLCFLWCLTRRLGECWMPAVRRLPAAECFKGRDLVRGGSEQVRQRQRGWGRKNRNIS